MRRWVKLWTEIIDDPKVALLSDKEFRALINLFALAGQIDKDGELGTKQEIAYRLRMKPSALDTILAALEQKGIRFIREASEKILLAAFIGRNGTPPSDFPSAVAARVKKHRTAKQGNSETGNAVTTSLRVGSNADVTPLDKNREDKNREEHITTGANAPAGASGKPNKTSANEPDEYHAVTKALEDEFSKLTGLPLPPRETKKQQAESATMWWNPLMAIWNIAYKDTDKAKLLMRDTIAHMSENKLTFDAPISIVRVCRSQSKTVTVPSNGHSKPAAYSRNGKQTNDEYYAKWEAKKKAREGKS